MTGRDPETAYLLGGWGFLDDTVRPDVQREHQAELAPGRDGWLFLDPLVLASRAARQAAEAREREEARRLRFQLLIAVSCLPAPDRDMLRAYLTTPVDLDVLAALFRTSEPQLWAALVATTRTLLPTLTSDLADLLPEPLYDALATDTAA